ncbi:MAG: DegT/DnrJ/EryC1/StrS family aminotransferase [Betaproteobacteria bacterium]
MAADTRAWPALPVFDWSALAARGTAPPGVLDHPRRRFTTSGRAALFHALRGLGVGPGDRVLVPTYHCPTMVSPVVALGAQPLFYPLAEPGIVDTCELGQRNLNGVKALIAAHFFGLPRPMQALRNWCDWQGIALVEDCAHAMFGVIEGRAVGGWGDYAITSLPKFLPVPEGGCLVAATGRPLPNDLGSPGLVRQLRGGFDLIDLASRHGHPAVLGPMWRTLRHRRPATPAAGATPPDADGAPEAVAPGLDLAEAKRQPVAAASLLAHHLRGDRGAARRRENGARLADRLAGHDGLLPVVTDWPVGSAPYVFAVWATLPDPGYRQLRRLGVPVFRWNWRWPGTPADPGDWGTQAAHHVLQVACHQSLTGADVDAIAAALRRVFGPTTVG